MNNIPQHISKQFDQELERIRASVLAMGGLVEQQLGDALKALKESNIELAEEVLNNEVKVNSYEVAIDEECIKILARRQPAAGDLRLLMAVIKTITDLERVGDEAQKIAKMARELSPAPGHTPGHTVTPRAYYIGIISMGNFVANMLHAALNAFARIDSRAALVTAGKEPESDEQYSAVLRQLITYMMEDPRSITSVIDAVWVARALERIGDHARNICEYVIYFVEGKDVRHISIEQMQAALKSKP